MSWIQNTFRGLLFKDVALDLTIQELKTLKQVCEEKQIILPLN